MRLLPSRRARRDATGSCTAILLFLPPALLLFTLFVVLPIGEAAWYSAASTGTASAGRRSWIGFDNYRFVFDTRAFWLGVPQQPA